MTHTVDFYESLTASQSTDSDTLAVDTIKRALKGVVKLRKGTKEEDKKGIDWWARRSNGIWLRIECKFLSFTNGDYLPLETWSKVGERIGWTRDASKHSDYVLWMYKNSMVYHMLPFPMLCDVFNDNWKQWRQEYNTHIQHTTTGAEWDSEIVYVPRLVIWNKLRTTFSCITNQPPSAGHQHPPNRTQHNQTKHDQTPYNRRGPKGNKGYFFFFE